MKSKNLLCIASLLFVMNGIAQNSVTAINAKDGTHHITTSIDYPITGTYFYKGAEPIVELKANGTGIFQLHDQPKKAMVWGMECKENGQAKFKKGFDSATYTLWYQNTSSLTSDDNEGWTAVQFSIHFNKLKMYIQGERIKDYVEPVEK